MYPMPCEPVLDNGVAHSPFDRRFRPLLLGGVPAFDVAASPKVFLSGRIDREREVDFSVPRLRDPPADRLFGPTEMFGDFS